MTIFYDEIPDEHVEWIARQKMFWVATAAFNGHVNLSSKGCIESFHIVNKNCVWYEDMTRGNGVETIAHIRRTLHLGTPEYDVLIPTTNRKAGSRAAIVIDVHKIATSFGFGILQYDFIGRRSRLERFCNNLERAEAKVPSTQKAPNGIKAWWSIENTSNIDGLPALESAHNALLAVSNSYDRDVPRSVISADPVAIVMPPSAIFFDGRLRLAAFA